MQQELYQNNTRTQSRYAAFWERHMGDPQRRLTLTKQSCLGVARQPMKVSSGLSAIEALPRMGTAPITAPSRPAWWS